MYVDFVLDNMQKNPLYLQKKHAFQRKSLSNAIGILHRPHFSIKKLICICTLINNKCIYGNSNKILFSLLYLLWDICDVYVA